MVLTVIQVILSLLLIIAVLVQEKGSGIGEALGGSAMSSTQFQTTKRGAEKILSQLTIVLVVAFLGVSLAINFV